jgi:hypothetical protein
VLDAPERQADPWLSHFGFFRNYAATTLKEWSAHPVWFRTTPRRVDCMSATSISFGLLILVFAILLLHWMDKKA